MNLKSLRNPYLYHGRIGKQYFEGWYFKLVDKTMEKAYAFIPGVFFSPNAKHSHAFIQIVDGIGCTYNYLKFPVESFSANRKYFEINIGENLFGSEEVNFNLDHEESQITGSVRFRNHIKWPDSLINPGSMGFYNYILKMQCYSQVTSMDFDLEGAIEYNGKNISFSGGRGYIEKNWGSAFPYSWIWIQCNHFKNYRASISCSLAHIPFLWSCFRGFLIGLSIENDFYKFTTMNRSKVRVNQSGTDVSLYVENSSHQLEIDCKTDEGDFILLNGPRDDQMVPLVQENLKGRVRIKMKETATGKIIIADQGECAGVEYGGDQMMVLD